MKRSNQATKPTSFFTPGLGAPGANAQAQVYVNTEQMQRLRSMHELHPTLQAASNVLESQVLSSGISLKLYGERAELTPEFNEHLQQVWVSFAREVLVSFLVYGFCVVSFETEDLDCATTLPQRKRMRGSDPNQSSNSANGTVQGGAATDSSVRNNGGPLQKLTEIGRFVDENIDQVVANTVGTYTIPVVAPPETYRLAFDMSGRGGYQRRYKVYRTGMHHGLEVDEDVVVFIRHPPDAKGNINSPVASVYEISSFVDGLVSMAHLAERGRAMPPLVTQVRKSDKKDGLDPSAMFFDGESREINRDRAAEEDEAHARATQMQLQLCRMLNQAHAYGQDGGLAGSIGGGRSNAAGLPTNSYTIPSDQEVAPHAPLPQTRTDLHDLLRISVDFMCTSMGVPASLIFEGRFAGRSTAQLALLNSTVKQLAREVDRVLTGCYNSIYDETGSDNVTMDQARVRKISATGKNQTAKRGADTTPPCELVTTTCALSSVDEVLAMFSGGLADYEACAPLAMNAIGMTQADIEAAMERHELLKKEEEKQLKEQKKQEEEDRQMATESQKLQLEAQKMALKTAKAGSSGASSGAGLGSNPGAGGANGSSVPKAGSTPSAQPAPSAASRASKGVARS